MEANKIENACKIVSKNVKHYRSQSGFSQAELAEKCNLSNNCISEIECSKTYHNSKTVAMIAFALGIQPYQLLLPEKLLNDSEMIIVKLILDRLQNCLNSFREEYFLKG